MNPACPEQEGEREESELSAPGCWCLVLLRPPCPWRQERHPASVVEVAGEVLGGASGLTSGTQSGWWFLDGASTPAPGTCSSSP